MRQNLRRVTQVLILLLLGSVVAIGFQNCGTYAPMENPLYDQDLTSTCVGFNCGTDPDLIELLVGNGSVIGVQKPATAPANCDDNNSKCFDVGGFCESGGYDTTRIYLQLDGPTPVSEYATTAACTPMGRFQVRVELPANYNYDQTYQLRVTLRGQDSNGPVDNPRNVHTQLITLVPVL